MGSTEQILYGIKSDGRFEWLFSAVGCVHLLPHFVRMGLLKWEVVIYTQTARHMPSGRDVRQPLRLTQLQGRRSDVGQFSSCE
jgi:hypothetical protein